MDLSKINNHVDILSIEQVDNSKYRISYSLPFIYNDICEFKVNRSFIYEKFGNQMVVFKPSPKKSDIAIKLGVKKHWISENKIQFYVDIDSKSVIVTTYFYSISNNIDIVKKFREHKLNKLING